MKSSEMRGESSGRESIPRASGGAEDVTAQDRAAEELRRSDARFRNLADTAPAMLWVTEPDGSCSFLSCEWYEFTGQTEQEGLGKGGFGWLDAVHPEDRERVGRMFLEANEKHRPFSLDYRLRRHDGEYRWAIDAGHPRFWPNGEFLGYIGSVLDITERKQTEAALKASETRFRAIFDQTFQFIGLMKTDGTLIEANRSALQFAGIREEDVLGKLFWETPWWTHSPDLQNRLREAVRQAAGGTMVRFEATHPRLTGELAHIDFSLKPVRDEHGNVTLLIPEGRDITERKRAEKALRESQEQFHAIMDNSPAMIFLKDDEGRYLLVNRKFKETFHLASGDLIGKTDEDIFPPERAAAFRANDRKVLEAGESMEFEEVALHDDGPHTSIVVKFPLVNQQGRCYALCGIATDITERKRTEEALKQSEERFGSFVRSTDDGIVMLDCLGLIIFWNPGAEKLFGYAQDEVLGKPMTLLMPERFRERHARGIERASAAGHLTASGSMFELVGLRKDGTEFPNELSLSSWSTRNGVFFTGIVRDVTGRRRAEEELKKSEVRYRGIFVNAVEGIFQTTLDGKYVAVNPALARMYGYDSPDEMIARITNIAAQLYVDPGRRDEFTRLMNEQGEVTGFEALVYRKAGTPIWISESVRAVRDSAGVLVGYEGTVEQITERKLAEERLRATLDQVRTLSGRLATAQEEERARIARELHDELGVGLTCLKIDLSRLATIVGGDIGTAACVRLDNKVRSMVGQVDSTITSVQRLVSQLRPPLLDDLGLVAAIEWQCQDFQTRTGIPCTCVTSADDIAMEPERARALFRICQEALTNTMRHAQATAVTVKLESRNGSLQLTVADNGLGIPDMKISDRRSLGLAGMRERVALFGGELTIQGHPQKGTTVTACLPRCLS